MSRILALDAARDASSGVRSEASMRAVSLWKPAHVGLVLAVGLLVGVHRAERNLSDSDVLWGTRSGLDTLSSGHLPHADTYSWTAAGRSWVPNSWAWNVVLGLSHRVMGTSGLYALLVLISVGFAGLVAATAMRAAASPVWTSMAVLGLGPVAMFIAPRAQSAALLPMLALPLVLPRFLQAADRGTVFRTSVTMVLIQVVWINIHTSGVLGPALVAVAGTGLITTAPRDRMRMQAGRLTALVVALSGACLLNPYGWQSVTHVLEVRSASAGLMQEWLAPGFGTPIQILGVVMSAVGALATWLAWRARRRDYAAILALLTIGSLTAIRFDPLVAAFAITELALAAARLKVRPHMARRTLAAGAVAVTALAMIGLHSFGRLGNWVSSPTLVSALPANCRVVNDMLVGGAIELRRPDVKVSLDSRNDMYGRDLVIQAAQMLQDAPGTQDRMATAGVNCVLALDSDKLVADLRSNPGWKVAGADGVRTLLLRVAPRTINGS